MDWMIMPLKRYADFSGRSQRMEYWMFALFQVLFIIFAAVWLGISGALEENSGGFGGAMLIIFGLLYLGLFFIPGLAVTVRRFHDQNRSGWFILLQFIPYIGGLIVFIFMCLDGTPGNNQYGPDPKGRGFNEDVFA
ncbi:MAG: DUF805 domain-containing protein [Pseudomonadota bacterium]